MPETAPNVKIKAVRGFGAEVILKGRTFADAAAELPRLVAERGLVLTRRSTIIRHHRGAGHHRHRDA